MEFDLGGAPTMVGVLVGSRRRRGSSGGCEAAREEMEVGLFVEVESMGDGLWRL